MPTCMEPVRETVSRILSRVVSISPMSLQAVNCSSSLDSPGESGVFRAPKSSAEVLLPPQGSDVEGLEGARSPKHPSQLVSLVLASVS